MANRIFMGLIGTGIGLVALTASLAIVFLALREPEFLSDALIPAAAFGLIGLVFFLFGIGVLFGTLVDASGESRMGEMSFDFQSPVSIKFDEPLRHITVRKPGLPVVLKRKQKITMLEAASAKAEKIPQVSGEESYFEHHVIVRLSTGSWYWMNFGQNESRARQTADRFRQFARRGTLPPTGAHP